MKKNILFLIFSAAITMLIMSHGAKAATVQVIFNIDVAVSTRALNAFCASTGYDFTSTTTTKLQWLKSQTIQYWNDQIENAESASQVASDQVTVHNNIQTQVAPFIN